MPQHTTTMEKTIEEWYEMFPEPIRSEALEARRKAIARGSSYSNDKTAESIEDAIVNGFGWYPDGGSRDKWREICDRAEAGEFDKPQATDIDARIASMEARIAELERYNREIHAWLTRPVIHGHLAFMQPK